MKSRLPLFLLLLLSPFSRPVQAQAPAYKQFEVDSVAGPLGSVSMLDMFLAINLRKPILAQAANTTGRVFLEAVVETDGRLSDLKIVRSLRPDCDREAMRIFRLFTAWKPAIKAGEPVRQVITYPVTFGANEPVVYQKGHQLFYLNSEFATATNPLKASYIEAIPIDTLTGLPNGDMVIYGCDNGKKGNEVSRFPLVRIAVKPSELGEEPTYQVGHKRPTTDWIGLIYTLKADGSLVSITPSDKRTRQTVTYHRSGSIAQIEDVETRKLTKWFTNGLLMSVEEKLPERSSSQLKPASYGLVSAWDSTGRAVVTGGTGYRYLYSQLTSRLDSSRKVSFTEEGAYVAGRQEGLWKGYAADGSYSYEEQFTKGDSKGGKATVEGKTLTYAQAEQYPAFKGGVEQMYRFLGSTINYPAEAARNKISGQVFVSFVVCTDGSLCEYEVSKSVHPSLDQEAIRVVKKTNGRWEPGLSRGEAVRVKYNLPISFRID